MIPDVDGYTAATTVFSFISDYLQYDNVLYIIQEDLVKAHGITEEVIRKVKNNGIKLLITPDSSSNDFEQQVELYEMGCKFIALDHHKFDSKGVPQTSIVINNQDGSVKNTEASGCFVTYKFCHYVAEQEGIDLGYNYLDLVNISNISDMRDMSNLENRYIYNIGKRVENITNKLIKSFIDDLKIKKILTIENVNFGIANKINAIIRNGSIDEKEALFESLIGSYETVTYKYKGKTMEQSIQDSILRIANRLRNSQKNLIKKCLDKGIKTYTNENDKLVIIDGTYIDSKITGLLANKLMREYNRPIMILKEFEGNLRGSCRGYTLDSFNNLCKESNLFNSVEGHDNSFGCNILKDNLEKFISYANEKLRDIEFDDSIEIDYVYDKNIPLEDVIDIAALSELWSNQIPSPKLLIRDIIINTKDISKRGINLSFKIDKIQFRKDYCSKVFYEDLIKLEENQDMDKDLKIDILCEVKTWESGLGYINIIEAESEVLDE